MGAVQAMIDKELHGKLKMICTIQGKTIGEVLRELIEEYVKEAESKQEPKKGHNEAQGSEDGESYSKEN